MAISSAFTCNIRGLRNNSDVGSWSNYLEAEFFDDDVGCSPIFGASMYIDLYKLRA